MKKKNKIVPVFIILAVLLFILAFYFMTKDKGNTKTVEEVKTVDNIEKKEFDYILYDNKSDLYKEYFAKLKEE